jgi:hypothetical protein
VPIAGTTQTSYTPQSTDVGHTLRVVVTAANGAGSASATSAPTALVQAASPSGTAGFAQIGATTCGGGTNYLDATGPWTTRGGSLATGEWRPFSARCANWVICRNPNTNASENSLHGSASSGTIFALSRLAAA